MKFLLAIGALLLVGGCCWHHSEGNYWNPDEEILYKADHKHSKDCGHPSHDGHWAYPPDSEHGKGCGVSHRRGSWYSLD